MSNPKGGAGPAPGPGPHPGPGPQPLPESPVVGSSNGNPGVWGKTRTGIAGVTGNSYGGVDGSPPTDGVLGDGLNGVHGTSESKAGSGVLGEHWAGGIGVSGSSPRGGTGVYGTTPQGDGVHGLSGKGPSHPVPWGAGTGVWGECDNGFGVYGTSQTPSPFAGVAGVNSGVGPGVYGEGELGEGVFGLGKNGVHGRSTSPTDSGVWGENTGSGYGVSGSSVSGEGVLGTGKNGVHGRSSSPTDSGVWGENTGFGYGVSGSSAGETGSGVWGQNTGAGAGVSASSQGGPAVSATSQGGIGVVASGAVGGVYATSDQGTAIVAQTNTGYAAQFTGRVQVGGDVHVSGDVVLGGGDCAEEFEIAPSVEAEPGTVMVLTNKGALEPSQQAYDRKVAGVISGAGECKAGLILGRRNSSRERRPLALVGKVYCRVDAAYSPVEIGDLLTTSPTVGHAMKADDPHKAFGAVIGKSLERLPSGQGLIPILIALQ